MTKLAIFGFGMLIGVVVCIAVMAFCILVGDLDELEEREGQR